MASNFHSLGYDKVLLCEDILDSAHLKKHFARGSLGYHRYRRENLGLILIPQYAIGQI